MGLSNLGQFFQATRPEKKKGDVTISYSQFAMWCSCPHKWKLTYVDKNRLGRPSIHTVFGSALHETIQWWLHVMFSKSVKESEQINLFECLQEQMMNHYAISVNDQCNGEHFSTPAELTEFYEDGVEILNWLIRNRSKYFSTKNYELVGIEIPLNIQASSKNEKVNMIGFLDVVFREKDTDNILILDIKSSTRGWNAAAKSDKLKASQLVLYKTYFAKQYGYREDSIKIQYFIVKRKLIEGFAYPQKRVQEFVPASGAPTRNKLISNIDKFIESGFNSDGSYRTDGIYPPIGGENFSNCKYCEFSKLENLCPKQNRIK